MTLLISKRLMNEEFLLNPSNQPEEYLIDLGAATNDAVKTSRLLLKRREDFVKAVRRS